MSVRRQVFSRSASAYCRVVRNRMLSTSPSSSLRTLRTVLVSSHSSFIHDFQSRKIHGHISASSYFGSTNIGIRSFSNSPSPSLKEGPKEDDDENTNAATSSPPSPPEIFKSSLRGSGQVIFLNSPLSGGIVLSGLAVGDPYLATLALAGVTTSTLAAKLGGLDQSSLGDGYNGALVGCAAAVFLYPLPPLAAASGMDLQTMSTSPAVIDAASWGLASTVLSASISPFVGVALKEAMGGVPQWTLAFNAVALGALIRTKPLAASPASATSEAVTTATTSILSLEMAAMAPLRGISQIFVVDSALTGAFVLGGTALYSPGLAGHLFLGSTVGSVTGYLFCSAPIDEIACGLWGYNSALTSIGIGTFFVHNRQTMALSIGGAAVTAGAFGALKVIFGMLDAPCLTLPFCAVMSGCYLLGRGGVQGLRLAASPQSPEKNE